MPRPDAFGRSQIFDPGGSPTQGTVLSKQETAITVRGSSVVYTGVFVAPPLDIEELEVGHVVALLWSNGSCYAYAVIGYEGLGSSPLRLRSYPSPPTNLVWTTDAYGVSYLSWTAPSSPRLSFYTVDASTSNWGASYTGYPASVGLVTKHYPGIKNGIIPALYFRVAVTNQHGLRSNWSSVAGPFEDLSIPANVTGLTGTPKPGAVKLSWTYTYPADFDRFDIYRNSVEVFETATLVASVGKTLTHTQTCGTGSWVWWVQAVDTSGNKAPSPPHAHVSPGALGGGGNQVFRSMDGGGTPVGWTLCAPKDKVAASWSASKTLDSSVSLLLKCSSGTSTSTGSFVAASTVNPTVVTPGLASGYSIVLNSWVAGASGTNSFSVRLWEYNDEFAYLTEQSIPFSRFTEYAAESVSWTRNVLPITLNPSTEYVHLGLEFSGSSYQNLDLYLGQVSIAYDMAERVNSTKYVESVDIHVVPDTVGLMIEGRGGDSSSADMLHIQDRRWKRTRFIVDKDGNVGKWGAADSDLYVASGYDGGSVRVTLGKGGIILHDDTDIGTTPVAGNIRIYSDTERLFFIDSKGATYDLSVAQAHGASAHSGSIFPGANQSLGAYYMDVAQIAAPTNPSSGTRRLFVDQATGKLSVRTSAGSTVSLEESGGGTVPTGTGFRHVTGGTEDAASKLVENADVATGAAIVESKLSLNYATHAQAHLLVSSNHTATGLTTGHVLRASGTTAFAFAQLQHTDLGGVSSDQHHAAVTLGSKMEDISSLTGQQLELDNQTANAIFAGPSSGGASIPTFRSMVVDDLVAHSLVSSKHTATGLTTGHVVRASGATTFAFAQLQHTDLGGVSSDQHHAAVTIGSSSSASLSLTGQQLDLSTQNTGMILAGPASGMIPGVPTFRAMVVNDLVAHDLISSKHTATGLTTGHVVRASGASSFSFAELQHGDLGDILPNQHHDSVSLGPSLDSNLLGITNQQLTIDSQNANLIFAGPSTGSAAAPSFRSMVLNDLVAHSLIGSKHTATGSTYDLVGLTGTNTLGMLTPSSTPGANAIAKTGSSSEVRFTRLACGSQGATADGSFLYTGNLSAYRNSTTYTGYIYVPISPVTGWSASANKASQTLDLQSSPWSLPAGIKAVFARLDYTNSTAATTAALAKNNSDAYAVYVINQGASKPISGSGIVECDANGDIYFYTSNSTNTVTLVILGYFI